MSSQKHTIKCHSNFLHHPNQRVPEQTLQGALPSSLQLLCSVSIRMQNITDQNDLDDKKHVNTHPSLELLRSVSALITKASAYALGV